MREFRLARICKGVRPRRTRKEPTLPVFTTHCVEPTLLPHPNHHARSVTRAHARLPTLLPALSPRPHVGNMGPSHLPPPVDARRECVCRPQAPLRVWISAMTIHLRALDQGIGGGSTVAVTEPEFFLAGANNIHDLNQKHVQKKEPIWPYTLERVPDDQSLITQTQCCYY
jgi:hypothetical protein